MLDAAQGKLATLAETRSEQDPVHVSEVILPYRAQVEARVSTARSACRASPGWTLPNGGPNRGTPVIIAPDRRRARRRWQQHRQLHARAAAVDGNDV